MTKIVVQPNASGTGTFTIAAPNSSNTQTLTLPDETGSVLTDQSNLAGVTGVGKVLQVVQAIKTDTFSTTSGTYVVVPDLSVTITPSSVSSKLLVVADIAASSTHYVYHAALFQDGVEIGKADAAGNRPVSLLSGTANGPDMNTDGIVIFVSKTLLLSPATTSAVTYDIRAARRFDNENSPTTYINRSSPDRNTVAYDSRHVSTLTVMEIAG